jgi:hypothetical protein
MTRDEEIGYVPPGIHFDAATHTYTVGGRVIPNVTSILKFAGLASSFDGVPPAVLEAKRSLGVAVHRATELDDADQLDESTVHPLVLPYLWAWRSFRSTHHFGSLLREHRVYHPTYQYAGTLDAYGILDGKPALVDLKTGDPEDAGARYQTAAYLNALQADPPRGLRIPALVARVSVRLRDDGTYRLTAYTERKHWTVFQAALTLFNELQAPAVPSPRARRMEVAHG